MLGAHSGAWSSCVMLGSGRGWEGREFQEEWGRGAQVRSLSAGRRGGPGHAEKTENDGITSKEAIPQGGARDHCFPLLRLARFTI